MLLFGAVSGNDEMHLRHAGKLARRVQHHAERLFGADVAGIKNGEIGAAQAEFRVKDIRFRERLDLGKINPIAHQTDPVCRDPLGDQALAHLARERDDAGKTPQQPRLQPQNKALQAVSFEMADRESGIYFEILHMEYRAGTSEFGKK